MAPGGTVIKILVIAALQSESSTKVNSIGLYRLIILFVLIVFPIVNERVVLSLFPSYTFYISRLSIGPSPCRRLSSHTAIRQQ